MADSYDAEFQSWEDILNNTNDAEYTNINDTNDTNNIDEINHHRYDDLLIKIQYINTNIDKQLYKNNNIDDLKKELIKLNKELEIECKIKIRNIKKKINHLLCKIESSNITDNLMETELMTNKEELKNMEKEYEYLKINNFLQNVFAIFNDNKFINYKIPSIKTILPKKIYDLQKQINNEYNKSSEFNINLLNNKLFDLLLKIYFYKKNGEKKENNKEKNLLLTKLSKINFIINKKTTYDTKISELFYRQLLFTKEKIEKEINIIILKEFIDDCSKMSIHILSILVKSHSKKKTITTPQGETKQINVNIDDIYDLKNHIIKIINKNYNLSKPEIYRESIHYKQPNETKSLTFANIPILAKIININEPKQTNNELNPLTVIFEEHSGYIRPELRTHLNKIINYEHQVIDIYNLHHDYNIINIGFYKTDISKLNNIIKNINYNDLNKIIFNDVKNICYEINQIIKSITINKNTYDISLLYTNIDNIKKNSSESNIIKAINDIDIIITKIFNNLISDDIIQRDKNTLDEVYTSIDKINFGNDKTLNDKKNKLLLKIKNINNNIKYKYITNNITTTVNKINPQCWANTDSVRNHNTDVYICNSTLPKADEYKYHYKTKQYHIKKSKKNNNYDDENYDEKYDENYDEEYDEDEYIDDDDEDDHDDRDENVIKENDNLFIDL